MLKTNVKGGKTIFTKNVQLHLFYEILLFILFLTSIVLFILLIKTRHKDYTKRKVTELDFIKETKYLLREQRHDYMNIFQVIYGYLQLNNSNKAIEQIKKAMISSSNSSKCFYLSVFSISLLLEKKVKVGEGKGIEIIVDVDSYVDSDIRSINNEKVIVEGISKLIDCFINCTYKENNGNKLLIDIYEHIDRIEFIFSGDIDENLLRLNWEDMNSIVRTEDGYEVIFYLDNTKEFLTENTIYSISNSY